MSLFISQSNGTVKEWCFSRRLNLATLSDSRTALGRASHTVDSDTLKACFPISVHVVGTTKHGAADDLSDLMLSCGCSRDRRYSGAEVV